MTEIRTVGVLGAGQMGAGISHVCALAGYPVKLHDLDAGRAQAALGGIGDKLRRQAAKGVIGEDAVAAALAHIEIVDDLAALGSSDLVIEAATENEAVKTAALRDLTPNL